ncbi:hypothetical protein ACLKA7_011864 [Drosophila subpalustris]
MLECFLENDDDESAVGCSLKWHCLWLIMQQTVGGHGQGQAIGCQRQPAVKVIKSSLLSTRSSFRRLPLVVINLLALSHAPPFPDCRLRTLPPIPI